MSCVKFQPINQLPDILAVHTNPKPVSGSFAARSLPTPAARSFHKCHSRALIQTQPEQHKLDSIRMCFGAFLGHSINHMNAKGIR